MENCTVAELKKMVSDKVFDKTIKPYEFTSGDSRVAVSDWTDLAVAFVGWLIEKGHLSEENLPIHNHAKRGKYYINSTPVHKYPEKDGYWHHVGNYHIDTKYNAEHHVKNILSTLNQLGVYSPDIKFSFHHF